MIFWTYASELPRDGLHVHFMTEYGTKGLCGAGGASFNIRNKNNWEAGKFFPWNDSSETFEPYETMNPVTCPRCLKRMAGLIRPDDENRGYVWHYKGCEIVSNEGHPNLPKYYCSIRESAYPCWTLRQGMQVIDKELGQL